MLSPIVPTLILKYRHQPATGPSASSSLFSHVRVHLSAWVVHSYRNETMPVRYFPCFQGTWSGERAVSFWTLLWRWVGYKFSMAPSLVEIEIVISAFWAVGIDGQRWSPGLCFPTVQLQQALFLKKTATAITCQLLTQTRMSGRISECGNELAHPPVRWCLLPALGKHCQGPRGSFKLRLGASSSP